MFKGLAPSWRKLYLETQRGGCVGLGSRAGVTDPAMVQNGEAEHL